MKNKEIKKLSNDELNNNLNKYKKDLFNMRFQKINGQIKSTAQYKEIRKGLARLKTYLGVVRAPPLPARDGPHGIRHDVADGSHRRREARRQRMKEDRI